VDCFSIGDRVRLKYLTYFPEFGSTGAFLSPWAELTVIGWCLKEHQPFRITVRYVPTNAGPPRECSLNVTPDQIERVIPPDDKEISAVPKAKEKEYRISVYLDDGRVFYYSVPSPEKVREHAAAIVNDGYRHNDGVTFEHYGPHRILKVKSQDIPTNYPDQVTGT